MTRTWPYPDLRNGTTVHHITDTHFGALAEADFVLKWLDSVAYDMDRLKVANNLGHVHTGDMIEWFAPYTTLADGAVQDSMYTTWRDSIKGIDGMPWVECAGNHDMQGPLNAAGTTRLGRTIQNWADSMGLVSPHQVVDMGDIRVITLNPDEWFRDVPAGDTKAEFRVPQATLDWLDAQLGATTKPCFIACHIVLQEQYLTINEDGYNAANVNTPALTDVLMAHSNVAGWLSGHKHIGLNNVEHAKVMTLPNGHPVFAINSPGCGGGTKAGVDESVHQWRSVNYSVYLTYFGDAVDVRWRNHNTYAWTGPTGETVRHLALP